jgi:nucleotide-binding universal stress UspA family protein
VVEEVVFTQHVTVSVEHVDDIVDQLEAEGKKRLKELYAKRVPEGVRTTARTVRGAPFLEILQAARKNKSDLVVMGTHGRTGLSHVLMGSTAEKVVRKCPCPVLTIKHPGHRFEHP